MQHPNLEIKGNVGACMGIQVTVCIAHAGGELWVAPEIWFGLNVVIFRQKRE